MTVCGQQGAPGNHMVRLGVNIDALIKSYANMSVCPAAPATILTVVMPSPSMWSTNGMRRNCPLTKKSKSTWLWAARINGERKVKPPTHTVHWVFLNPRLAMYHGLTVFPFEQLVNDVTKILYLRWSWDGERDVIDFIPKVVKTVITWSCTPSAWSKTHLLD